MVLSSRLHHWKMAVVWNRHWSTSVPGLFIFILLIFRLHSLAEDVERHMCDFEEDEDPQSLEVRLRVHEDHVVMDNGILELTLAKPEGSVLGVKYKGVENLLSPRNGKHSKGYLDCAWEENAQWLFLGNSFQVIHHNTSQAEVSFKRTWDPCHPLGPAMNVDKRFIMLSGSSGFYSYAIYERLPGWKGTSLWQTRLVFKLNENIFDYMAMSDTRQMVMSTDEDREKGETLAYKEAVLLTNTSNPHLKVKVDDKYQYAADSKDNKVHGWISQKFGVGFWIITPSGEFHIGGPLKQMLTSHTGPTLISAFTDAHYVGKPAAQIFDDGESWKKVFGPIFIYLNSVPNKEKALSLWGDAKRQMGKEVKSWPYSFPLSPDFPKPHQRGSLTGRLLVMDRYINSAAVPGRLAYVGLSLPGSAGSWQTETKGYQFWDRTDTEGRFSIRAVRAGKYNLFGWVPGIMGDYKYHRIITINSGSRINLGNLVFKPPRHGPTLWNIGIPDRTAAEFFVPDVNPKFMNKLYEDNDRFRQYGLWHRYTDMYPEDDLVYTVGKSDYRKDWFFAHVNRHVKDGLYQPTTWQIVFYLPVVEVEATYKFRLVLAGANLAELQVRVNYRNARQPLLSTKLIGRENMIARHGIHGLLWSFDVDIPGSHFVEGRNTIYLTQTRAMGPFQGVLYDYIRLEGPPR